MRLKLLRFLWIIYLPFLMNFCQNKHYFSQEERLSFIYQGQFQPSLKNKADQALFAEMQMKLNNLLFKEKSLRHVSEKQYYQQMFSLVKIYTREMNLKWKDFLNTWKIISTQNMIKNPKSYHQDLEESTIKKKPTLLFLLPFNEAYKNNQQEEKKIVEGSQSQHMIQGKGSMTPYGILVSLLFVLEKAKQQDQDLRLCLVSDSDEKQIAKHFHAYCDQYGKSFPIINVDGYFPFVKGVLGFFDLLITVPKPHWLNDATTQETKNQNTITLTINATDSQQLATKQFIFNKQKKDRDHLSIFDQELNHQEQEKLLKTLSFYEKENNVLKKVFNQLSQWNQNTIQENDLGVKTFHLLKISSMKQKLIFHIEASFLNQFTEEQANDFLTNQWNPEDKSDEKVNIQFQSYQQSFSINYPDLKKLGQRASLIFKKLYKMSLNPVLLLSDQKTTFSFIPHSISIGPLFFINDYWKKQEIFPSMKLWDDFQFYKNLIDDY